MANVLTNASNFTMDNAQFNVAQTNIHQGAIGHNDPMRMLLSHSALSAMADSPTVYEPTCHPGTRTLVSDHIMVWARDPKATPILWLSGPAGAGKSCIQRTIVQSTTAEGLFVACFFFSIKQSETNNQARFVATLAAQLAENIPGLKWYIERAVKKDSRVFTKALELQAQGLILKPLQELDNSMWNRLKRVFWTLMALVAYKEDPDTPRTRANVIVIDGLDECADQTEQARVLGLIHSLATHPQFPFRFAIASRPEYAIRTAFSSTPMSNDTLVLRLEEYEADEDLRRFMKAEFSRLTSGHPAFKSIPTDWPSVEHENLLITKASRQFVYVSVVMKHLRNPRRNPMLELQHIVGHRPSANDIKSNPFAELDALYDRILHPPDIDSSLLKPILHSVIHDKRGVYLVDNLDLLFGLRPATKRPIFHHKSMEDFLISESRAGHLYQSSDQTHAQLTLAYYQLGRLCQDGVTVPYTCDYVWDIGELALSHACSVTDWSVFKKSFSKKLLPAFIGWLVQTQTELTPLELKLSDGRAHHPNEAYTAALAQRCRELDPYSRRYHFFFCTSEDGCLPRCKQLRQMITMYGGNNADLAHPAMVDILSTASCRCTESGNAKESDGESGSHYSTS